MKGLIFHIFLALTTLCGAWVSEFCNTRQEGTGSKVLGAPQGGAIPRGADVSTCKSFVGYGRAIRGLRVSPDPLVLLGEVCIFPPRAKLWPIS